jgi:Domain of unknown function (DUF4145)
MGNAVVVADCPRCRSKQMTFDVHDGIPAGTRYEWQRFFETFCICRNCRRSTVFVISQRSYGDSKFLTQNPPETINGSLNPMFEIEGHISLKDMGGTLAPEYVPEQIANAFHEGATGVMTNCPNAAGAMFRLVVDLATRPMLPPFDADNGPSKKIRRDLGLRLPWLFQNGHLPRELEDLSHCIREDGNDGAHAGTLKMEDALDLQDFCGELLERLFTEPERIRLAAARRIARRAAPGSDKSDSKD